MTKAEDKAEAAEAKKADAAEAKQDKADAKQEEAISKSDEAFKTYQKEQAEHEKKHPGEIDEAAYAKYGKVYDKIPEDHVMGDEAPAGSDLVDPVTGVAPTADAVLDPVPVSELVPATESHAPPGSQVPRPQRVLPPSHLVPHKSYTEVSDVAADGKQWMVTVWFATEADANAFQGGLAPHAKKPAQPTAPVSAPPASVAPAAPVT